MSALLFKELLLKETEKYAPVFNLNRIKPIAGFTNFVKENADVAKKWMGKLLPSDKLEHLYAYGLSCESRSGLNTH